MSVIITMAGAGSRFANEGYLVPKHKVMANGKTLFEWSLLSLQKFFDQPFIFACLAAHDHTFIKQTAHGLGIKDVIIAPRHAISNGQAQTAADCLSHINDDAPLWIYNIDTYVANGFDPNHINGASGCIYVFESTSPNMSFVRCDDNNHVVEVAEKKVISNLATVGMYGFASAALYQTLYQQAYVDSDTNGKSLKVNGECYIAPMYQLLIDQPVNTSLDHKHQNVITAPKLKLEDIHILGTPKDVLAFDANAVAPFGAQ